MNEQRPERKQRKMTMVRLLRYNNLLMNKRRGSGIAKECLLMLERDYPKDSMAVAQLKIDSKEKLNKLPAWKKLLRQY